MFCLSFNSDFYVSEIMHLWAGSLPRKPSGWVSGRPGRGWGGFVRPRAALLFWFFAYFRCGMPLFIVILVICKKKIGKSRCEMLD